MCRVSIVALSLGALHLASGFSTLGSVRVSPTFKAPSSISGSVAVTPTSSCPRFNFEPKNSIPHNFVRLWAHAGVQDSNNPLPEGSLEAQRNELEKVGKTRGRGLKLRSGTVSILLLVAAAGLMPTAGATKKFPFHNAGVIFLIYILCNRDVRRRVRFSGVVPRDPESRRKLADDAEMRVTAMGRPTRRLTLLAIDMGFIFTIFSSLASCYRGPIPTEMSSLRWWPHGVYMAFVTALTAFANAKFRTYGFGYVRYELARWIVPYVRSCIIRPAKAVVSVVGMGKDWDMGSPGGTESVGEDGMTSRKLRESLSTFRPDEDDDIDFSEDIHNDVGESSGSTGGEGI